MSENAEKQNENKDINNEETKNYPELLENLKQIDSEITFNVKELENYFEKIQKQFEEWSEQEKLFKDILAENVNKLARETKVFALLPEKIETRLTNLVPSISTELAKQIFDEFDNRLTKTKTDLDDLLEIKK